MMIVFLLVIAIITIALIALIIGVKEPQRQFGPPNLQPLVTGDLNKGADKQSGDMSLLSQKLTAAKEEKLKLEAELMESKKKEAFLQEELRKLKEWVEKTDSEQKSPIKEAQDLKEKIVKKDREYEEQFSQNIKLKKELEEYKLKADAQDKANKDYDQKIKLLDAQNQGYKEELLNRDQLIAEFRKKEQDAQWVSKKEYDKLKEQIDKGGLNPPGAA